ncbi:MAG: FAD-dependent oxidoreductase [Rhodospirillaceae bacterium]|nr:FAD-dependent oxidoreductase [Rhodospirillaceae bacterium]
MKSTKTDVIVIGAGQAGLATSYYLTKAEIKHLILERGSIANAWKNERWDSFCLVTPNWTINLPGALDDTVDPEGFMNKNEFVKILENWAKSFQAPVVEGICVNELTKTGNGFKIITDSGNFFANQVIIATATYQRPKIPQVFSNLDCECELKTVIDYKNPDSLREGGVLVVGSGQSGCQIAEELNNAGCSTYLSIGHTGRLPRRYRGADCIKWQLEMGWLDRCADFLDDPKKRFSGDPHLSGKNGGYTLSLHELRSSGVTLLGRIKSVDGSVLKFRKDVNSAIEASDKYAKEFRRSVDEFIENSGQTVPSPTGLELNGEPEDGSLQLEIIEQLDLSSENISTVIVATGFEFDFSWVKFPVLDETGYPKTNRGMTIIPGLYFMGLNWMYKRKSGIIFGVAEDAEYIVERVNTTKEQRIYSAVAER